MTKYTMTIIGENSNVIRVDNNAGKKPVHFWVRDDHLHKARSMAQNQDVEALRNWVDWEKKQEDCFTPEPTIFKIKGDELESVLSGNRFFWGMC